MAISKNTKIGIAIGVVLVGVGLYFGFNKIKKAKSELQKQQDELELLKAQEKTAKTGAEKASAKAKIEAQKAKVEATKLQAEKAGMGYAQYTSSKANEVATSLNIAELDYNDIVGIVKGIPTQNHYKQVASAFFAINKHSTLDTFVKSKVSPSEYESYKKMVNAKPRFQKVATSK